MIQSSTPLQIGSTGPHLSFTLELVTIASSFQTATPCIVFVPHGQTLTEATINFYYRVVGPVPLLQPRIGNELEAKHKQGLLIYHHINPLVVEFCEGPQKGNHVVDYIRIH